MSNIKLTFTQCKQISNNVNLRDFVDQLNDQPEFMADTNHGMGIDSICELQSILQCGCAGDAHNSVFYYQAGKCMADHGDDVLEYIENQLGELPAPKTGASWNQIASDYLSMAVELWCAQFDEALDGVDWV